MQKKKYIAENSNPWCKDSKISLSEKNRQNGTGGHLDFSDRKFSLIESEFLQNSKPVHE